MIDTKASQDLRELKDKEYLTWLREVRKAIVGNLPNITAAGLEDPYTVLDKYSPEVRVRVDLVRLISELLKGESAHPANEHGRCVIVDARCGIETELRFKFVTEEYVKGLAVDKDIYHWAKMITEADTGMLCPAQIPFAAEQIFDNSFFGF